MRNTFGLTNDVTEYTSALLFKGMALEDGWVEDPTGMHDGSFTKLTKAGFVCHVIARVMGERCRYKYQASVSLWGPDGLAILAPLKYDFGTVVDGLRRCMYCHKENVDVEKVGFAGRCCAECLPAVKLRVERPGWTA